MRSIPRATAAALLLLAAAAGDAGAQAFCSLRDPTMQIYQQFPGATRYRSIVATVGEEARNDVAERLPFTLHFNELGQHTIYMVLDGSIPMGFVHARSEQSEWGLVEIVWALNLDMTIRGFTFQRCRSPSRDDVLSNDFMGAVAGKSFGELRALLSEDGDAYAPGVSLGHPELGVPVLRCALKTIAVTESAWRQDVRGARLTSQALRDFPGAELAELIVDVDSPDLDARMAAMFVEGETGIRNDSIIVLRVGDREGALIGHLVYTDWLMLGKPVPVEWVIDAGGQIADVRCLGLWPSLEVGGEFQALAGKRAADLQQCKKATELAAAHVLAVCLEIESRR